MTRLIYADELMKYAHDVTLANGARHRCIDATVIYDIPTVDAEPVRQGKWIPRTAMTFFGTEETLCMMCSACGTDALTGEGFEYMPKYCPHCGARMDEE